MKDPIFINKLIDEDIEIAASGTLDTDVMHFAKNTDKAGRLGSLSLFLVLTGTGTLKVEAKTNGDDVDASTDYATKTPEIITTAGAGTHHVAFSIPLSSKAKLALTEDGGANAITVNKCYVLSR